MLKVRGIKESSSYLEVGFYIKFLDGNGPYLTSEGSCPFNCSFNQNLLMWHSSWWSPSHAWWSLFWTQTSHFPFLNFLSKFLNCGPQVTFKDDSYSSLGHILCKTLILLHILFYGIIEIFHFRTKFLKSRLFEHNLWVFECQLSTFMNYKPYSQSFISVSYIFSINLNS